MSVSTSKVEFNPRNTMGERVGPKRKDLTALDMVDITHDKGKFSQNLEAPASFIPISGVLPDPGSTYTTKYVYKVDVPLLIWQGHAAINFKPATSVTVQVKVNGTSILDGGTALTLNADLNTGTGAGIGDFVFDSTLTELAVDDILTVEATQNGASDANEFCHTSFNIMTQRL